MTSYIYFSLGFMKIYISPGENPDLGELIGTSKTWHEMRPAMKKFILANLMNKSPYPGLTGLEVDDYDTPKPPEETE